MQKMHVILTIAIIDLMMASVLFTGQQYFSAAAMLLLLVLGLVSAIGFMVPALVKNGNSKKMSYFTACMLLASILIIGYEANFSLISPGTLSQDTHIVALASVGSLILSAGVYAAERFARGKNAPIRQAAILVILLVAATAAYLSMFGLGGSTWRGSDELAFNYYAAQLALRGQNPYTQSMLPILAQKQETPTILLNGSYETAYDYPPMSFITFAFIPALGIQSFFIYIFVLMFMVEVSAFVVYAKSGPKVALLLPLGAWFFSTYILVGVVAQYLAVSIFVLFAYLNRNKPLLSGCLLGLAGSTVQLAWFALPFFYLLSLRDSGKKAFCLQVFSSAIVFLGISAAFLIASPTAYIGNIAGIFKSNSLVFTGTDIAQYAVAFYPLPGRYLVFVSALVMLAALTAFYFYRKSASPLLALAPAFIFFISWRNFLFYSLPFIPILLVMYYGSKMKEHKSDIIKSRRPLLYLLVLVVIVAAFGAAYAHETYVNNRHIQLNRFGPSPRTGRPTAGARRPARRAPRRGCATTGSDRRSRRSSSPGACRRRAPAPRSPRCPSRSAR